MGYKEIAIPLAERGVPTVPLKPRSKIAFMSGWETLATTDRALIERWDAEYPNANGAAVAQAKSDGFWFLEVDKPEVVQRIESEAGQRIPRTYRVRSSPGRGHFYWRQTAESLAMGNLTQGYVKHGDWSARVDRQYVVAAKSSHPKTGLPYEIVSTADIIAAPKWLIDWLLSQKLQTKNTPLSMYGDPIPYGAHDSTLARIAGKLRYEGMEENSLTETLIEICEKRCINYGNDYKEMCSKIAKSICRYDVGQDERVFIGGVEAGTATQRQGIPAATTVAELEEPPKFAPVPYPTFPRWVFEGCSIYNGLVRPWCEKNSRYPEFLFMPAMAMLLNYVALKVHIEHDPNMIPSIFMVCIGRKGRVIKSSSVEDAIEYLRYAGVTDHANQSVSNANGKSLVWTVGSPEGLGIEMTRTNCRNAVLFYDELSTLTNKASIESSSLQSTLLSTYESGKFQNVVKSKKDSYAFDPRTYCMTLIACSTDKNFLKHWSKLAGASTGLDDRFFFLMQPETLDPLTIKIGVNTMEAAAETRKLIDKAIAQKVYKVFDTSPLVARMEELGNRVELRAEKFALGFAIDLGRDELDEDCVERALAVVTYEKQVKNYLRTFEGFTREGSIQMELTNMLRSSGGRMAIRDMERKLHPERYGTSLWFQVYSGLIKNGWIREEGSGVKGDPKSVVLLRAPEEDDD